ncbi:hypothetical protein YK48G_14330 [Lentilactobacillus fungorum]|uniref:Uncharacterized protein n=1 Tax=Lentilactobacillus fungorum TaxID=2201250 RepID=A0ABQ3VZ55_9LACO|nr:hypothetical protein [Lentilactobacillus fungorum]GHP14008.1 hypothetical protein YK48G_14330 [Lentilactobacillus fungorum]
MKSDFLTISQNKRGAITKFQINDDPTNMNWVIDPDYLASLNYHDLDKLFGEFNVTIDGKKYRSIDFNPQVTTSDLTSQVSYHIDSLDLVQHFKLTGKALTWQFTVTNQADREVTIHNLGLWVSLAYVMFRDKNVQRNANQSAAIFPSISQNYTKLAAIRRDNTQPNLGLYQTKGNVLSVGTFNEYTNRFFENVSPSLDGMLFHEIILAGGYDDDKRPHHDWIYPQTELHVKPGQTITWAFALQPFGSRQDFYQVAKSYGHPRISFEPLVQSGQRQRFTIELAKDQVIKRVVVKHHADGRLIEDDISDELDGTRLIYQPKGVGEHEIWLTFADGTSDMGVFNVMSSVSQLLRNRANYVSTHSYSGASGKVPYSFSPVSNQGESLGKLTFIVQECLLDPKVDDIAKQIAQVEESAVKYVRPKWFINGDFKHPRKLYGDFYRVMDFEYIAHLFYLLSKVPTKYLHLNSPKDYLAWAAQVFDVRVNPDLHDNQRGKEEAQMLGLYFTYIEDLLKDVKAAGLDQEYAEISKSWAITTDRVAQGAKTLSAAMTEHFFDNAGFGPATGALALTGNLAAAKVYGELLKANIGFSNDFRSQSPDRWWEALSYMVHSLWGGITAAAAQVSGENLQDVELVQAGYRATNAILYMYDSNASTTDRFLKPGEAASTYSIAGPNVNRPDLSRNRFGQSIFAEDGGIFSRLFPDGYTGEDDWDMGEELVAYLNGFGQTTYLYSDDQGQLHAINGAISQLNSTDYQIQSFAPYCRRYVNLDDGNQFVMTAKKVIFDVQSNVFHPVRED